MPDLIPNTPVEPSLEAIKGLDTKISTLATFFEKHHAEYEKTLDSIKGYNLDKVSEDMSSLLQQKQDNELHQKEIQKRLDGIERAALSVNPSSAEDHSVVNKYVDQMTRYVRFKTPIEAEVMQNYLEKAVNTTTYGAEADMSAVIVKTFAQGSNPDGGYWFIPERSQTVIRREFETSPMLEIASVETSNSDGLEFIIDDEQIPVRDGLGELDGPVPTATPKIGLLTIPVHNLDSEPKVTRKMAENLSFDIQSYIMRKANRDFTIKTNTNYVIGDGAQRARGFLDLPAWAAPGVYERFKLEQINSGAAAALTADGLIDLQNALLEFYQSRAVFVMKRQTFGELIKLKDDNKNYLINFAMLKEGTTMQVLGKRVIFMDDVPAVGANSLSVAYGDFGIGYTIVNRQGLTVVRDELTDKPFIKFYMTFMTGGGVTNFESIKIQKTAA